MAGFTGCANENREDKSLTLFNGKNLDGWKMLNGTAVFRVENGVITGVSSINTPNTFFSASKFVEVSWVHETIL